MRHGLDRLATAWTLSGAQPTSTGGRPTYTVRIAPKDDGGLLGAAELAWDAVNGVPLRAAVYAQGQDEPVLELEADEVSYGEIDGSTFDAEPPEGTRVVEIDPPTAVDEHGRPTRVRGVEAVQQRLPFELSAPAELAGLPRTEVRLVDADGSPGAVSVYGEGMGAIVVLQHKAGAAGRRQRRARSCPRSTSTARPAPRSRRRWARSCASSATASPTRCSARSRRWRPRTRRGGC